MTVDIPIKSNTGAGNVHRVALMVDDLVSEQQGTSVAPPQTSSSLRPHIRNTHLSGSFWEVVP